MGNWGSDSIIELIALMLAIPGAIAAVLTLWILLSRRASVDASRSQDVEHLLVLPEADEELNTRRAADWFQDQYTYLHRTVTAEREEWAEEMGLLDSVR